MQTKKKDLSSQHYYEQSIPSIIQSTAIMTLSIEHKNGSKNNFECNLFKKKMLYRIDRIEQTKRILV